MTAPATVRCPACGAKTSGKFCSECGTPLGERTCAACGAKLPARAKFCSECGTPTGVAPARPAALPTTGGGPDRVAWMVAGLAVLALIVTVIVVATRRGAATEAAGPQGPALASRAPDISRMSPREAADRLYDRVARLSEAGNTDSVAFFAPMALQAYANVEGLDADVRFHIGLIHLATGDGPAAAAAAAQADTILRAAPQHLLGLLLRARAADARHDATTHRRALRSFLAAFDAERARNLPEYQQHAQILDATREEARRVSGGTGSAGAARR